MRFTLGRLFVSLTLIAVSVAGFTLPLRLPLEEFEGSPLAGVYLTLFCFSPMVLGAGIGNLWGRLGDGVAIGFVFGLLLSFVSAAQMHA